MTHRYFRGVRIILGLVLVMPFFGISTVHAACPTATPTPVNIVARGFGGDFIPNMNVQVLNQIIDVDGLPKPGTSVGQGKIDPISGRYTICLATGSKYVVKFWQTNASVGEFWYFNQFTELIAATEITQNFYLSGAKIILRSTQDDLKINQKFSIFLQEYDANDIAIKGKLVATFDTGAAGEAVVYVGNNERSLDKNRTGYYILESTGANNAVFTKKGIYISDGSTNEITYRFSDTKITLKDAQGDLFPTNFKIEFFKRIKDIDGTYITGSKIGEASTNSDGQAIFEYPDGEYYAGVKGGDGLYTYFSLRIDDQARSTYTFQTPADFDDSSGACGPKSELTFIARNSNTEPINGLKFELYVEAKDVNGKPIPGAKLTGGTTGASGSGTVQFNPDQRKLYILKLYDANAGVGDFWFYDHIKFSCGDSRTIEKTLSSIKMIIRDGAGTLLSGQAFSISTQKLDVDGKPVKSKADLVGTFTTSQEGYAITYVASDHPYITTKRGYYVFSSSLKDGGEYTEYNIRVLDGQMTTIEYVFSDMLIRLNTAFGMPMESFSFDVYKQEKDLRGNPRLAATKLKTIKTDANGDALLVAPAGTYALVFADSGKGRLLLYNVTLKDRVRSSRTISLNAVRISGHDTGENLLPEKTAVTVYKLILDRVSGYYIRGATAVTSAFDASKSADLRLEEGYYLVGIKNNNVEYVAPVVVKFSSLFELDIITSENYLSDNNTRFKLVNGVMIPFSKGTEIFQRIAGLIVLQVEKKGEAWYMDPISQLRYYLKDGPTAYKALRNFGLGITTVNVSKIPVGLDSRLYETDTDSDGLADPLERALGTDPLKKDTDGDSFSDYDELKASYDPLKGNRTKLVLDKNLANKLKGRILLQVDKKGEAWYINPKDGLRYYLADGPAAYRIMRFLGVGIKTEDLEKVRTGTIK